MFSGWVSCTRRSLLTRSIGRSSGRACSQEVRARYRLSRTGRAGSRPQCAGAAVLLPDVDETNKTFYADVWQPQEIQHGLILDRLQQDLGRTAAKPHLDVSFKIKILGALAHLKPIKTSPS